MGALVDVLDGSLAVPQLGAAQPDLKAPGVAIGRLAIEQQRQPSACESSAAWARFCNSTKASAMPSRFNALSWSGLGWVSIVFSSMKVTGATDVGVRNRRPVRGRCGPFGFEAASSADDPASTDQQMTDEGCLSMRYNLAVNIFGGSSLASGAGGMCRASPDTQTRLAVFVAPTMPELRNSSAHAKQAYQLDRFFRLLL